MKNPSEYNVRKEHLISGCSLCVFRASAWKPASVHEIRMTLNRVPFSSSQIKVYWRPMWKGKVAMATSVKRASDLTRNQSINLWFLSCLIKKVCMWLMAHFWEYEATSGLLAPSSLKGSHKGFATSKTRHEALVQERTQLCEVTEKKLLWNEKAGGKNNWNPLWFRRWFIAKSNPIHVWESDNNATARNPKSITLNCFLKYWGKSLGSLI